MYYCYRFGNKFNFPRINSLSVLHHLDNPERKLRLSE